MAHPQSSDSRQEVVLQLVDWASGYNVNTYTRYEVLNRTSDLDSSKRPKQWSENGRDDVDWISLAQNWKKWLTTVRTTMNHRVIQNVRNFLKN